MKEDGLSLMEKAADRLGLPGQLAAGVTQITITGRSCVFIENHRGLLEYGEETIRVNAGKFAIVLTGKGLGLRAMNSSELVVTGILDGIGFERRAE